MAKPAFTDSDFAGALLNLMPGGRIWSRDPDSVQVQAISCYAPSFRRSSDAGVELLADAFPSSTVNLLDEWEATFGLPDPCAGKAPTLQARRAQVLARFSGSGGQSISDFVSYAAGLGYEIKVREFAPFRMGQSACGDPLGGPEWFHTWAVQTQQNTITRFRMGSAAVGEALATWGNAVLECELKEIAPAHTILQFQYLTQTDDSGGDTTDPTDPTDPIGPVDSLPDNAVMLNGQSLELDGATVVYTA